MHITIFSILLRSQIRLCSSLGRLLQRRLGAVALCAFETTSHSLILAFVHILVALLRGLEYCLCRACVSTAQSYGGYPSGTRSIMQYNVVYVESINVNCDALNDPYIPLFRILIFKNNHELFTRLTIGFLCGVRIQ